MKMEADDQYKISGKNFFPIFKNRETEQEFAREFNRDALKSGRIGIIVIIVLWAGFTWFDWHLPEPGRSDALFFRLAVITPVFLLIFAALCSRKFAEAGYQILICVCFFIIEASIYHVVKFYDFQMVSVSLGYPLSLTEADGKSIFVFVWLLVVFMASSTARTAMVVSVINGMVFILFNVFSILTNQPSVLVVIIMVPFFIAVLPVVWIDSLRIQRYARENFRASKLLTKYLSPQLADSISNWQVDRIWKHSRQKLTLFFSDIRDFTKITDAMEPEDMARLLNEYLARMNVIVTKHNGTLTQVIGDGLYVVFGAPEKTTDQDHALRCVRMAVEMQTTMRGLSLKWYEQGVEEKLKIRCGINTGMATVGGYGSSDRKEYTAMGMQVNIAARLEAACRPGNILISHTTWALVKDEFECRDIGTIDAKGYHKPVKVYEIEIP